MLFSAFLGSYILISCTTMGIYMGPAPSLVTPERPALFRRMGVAEYFRGFYSCEPSGKSNVDVMRIQNDTH
jgi:hypothetical protein